MNFFKMILKRMISKLHIKPIILFESYPDLSDNTFAVYKELVNRGYNKKFKFVWQLCDRDKKHINFIKNNNDSFCFLNYSNIFEHLKISYYRNSADILICCNIFFEKKNNNQKYIYLSHGVALKDLKGTYHLPESARDATVITLSDFFIKYDMQNLYCESNNTIPLGFPRNDVLMSNSVDLTELFPNSQFSTAVYWMPTYRQHKSGMSVSSISIPIIHDDNICKHINAVAKENGVLIILKPHPAQDLSFVNSSEYSNLIIIDNDFLVKNEINNYELLSSCDALITDYSSVYCDYLLCDKPIGLCWEDIEEYSKKEGFIADVDYIMSGGEKLYTPEDFCDFIKRVANGEDVLKNERLVIKKVVHKHADFHSTQRVVDYIEENFLKNIE